MTDIEIVYDCLFYKTYQNKVQFQIEIDKISDRKILAGLLMDLSVRSKDYEVDRDEMIQLSAELLSKEELKTDYLLESVNYFKDAMKSVNGENLSEANFLLEFYTILKDKVIDVNDNSTVSVSEDEVKDLLINNKEHLPALKYQLIESELYEIIPLIDKYI
jgi:hypothetical protein